MTTLPQVRGGCDRLNRLIEAEPKRPDGGEPYRFPEIRKLMIEHRERERARNEENRRG